MSKAPKFYSTHKPKPEVRNPEALERHCAEMADNLAALSKQIRAQNAAKRKAEEKVEIESPDEIEREAEA